MWRRRNLRDGSGDGLCSPRDALQAYLRGSAACGPGLVGAALAWPATLPPGGSALMRKATQGRAMQR